MTKTRRASARQPRKVTPAGAARLSGRGAPIPGAPHIGQLREFDLHADLKRWYAQPGDALETALDGYVIDIRRGDMLIEIQTRSFSAMRRKLAALAQRYPVRIVHPIPETKWIVRLDPQGGALARRRSPKAGRIETLFKELVAIPDLVGHPNVSFDIALTHEEELWQQTGRRAWRRKGWCVVGRRLVTVNRVVPFADAADFCALLPAGLVSPFTTRDLATAARLPLNLAYKMTYCLRRMGAIAETGKRKRAALYALTTSAPTG